MVGGRPVRPPGTDGVTRVAAIDCGTNSIRLLVADVPAERRAHRPAAPDGGRAARSGRRRHRPARAGGDRAHPAGARRVRRRRPATSVRRRCGWSPPAPPGTRPTGHDFEDMVLATLGAAPDVVTGREEAELSFLGATASLDAAAGRTARARRDRRSWSSTSAAARPSSSWATRRGPGGALGRHRLRPADRAAPARRPADGGGDRAAPRPTSGPPWPTSRAEVPVAEAASLVGLAGSVTTVAALALRAARLRPGRDPRLAGSRSTPSVRSPPTCSPRPGERRAAMPVMHPGRVDVIGAGALVLAGAHGRVRHGRGRGQRARHPRRHRAAAGCASRRPRRRRPVRRAVRSSRRSGISQISAPPA